MLGKSASLGFFHIQQVETESRDGAAHHHLANLRHGDPDGLEPLGLAVNGHEKVVKVHDGVNTIVHGAKDHARGGIVEITKVAKGQYRDVVVPMQKDERLFVDNDKERVNKLTDAIEEKEEMVRKNEN